MLRYILTTFFFLTFVVNPASAQIDEYEIWQGQYSKIRQSVQSFVKEQDKNQGWSNRYQKTNLISMVGRFASIMDDLETLDWAYSELTNISQEITESPALTHNQKYYSGLRIASLYDLLYFLDPGIKIESKLKLWDEKYKSFGGTDALWDEEYIWFCNVKLDILIEAKRYSDAEKAVFTCSGKIALRKSYNTTAAFTFLARVLRLYTQVGNWSNAQAVSDSLTELFNNYTIIEKSPHAILSFSILARSFYTRGDHQSTKIILGLFERLHQINVAIPPQALENIAWVRAEENALRGNIDEIKKLKLSGPNLELFQNLALTVSGKSSLIRSEGINNLGSFFDLGGDGYLYALAVVAGQLEDAAGSEELYKNYLDFVVEGLDYHDTERFLPLAIEKFEGFDSNLLQAIILTRLVNRFGENLPSELNETLLNLFIRARTRPAQASKLLNAEAWNYDVERLNAKNILKISTDLSEIVKRTWFQIVSHSVTYTEDYKYREPVDLDGAGKYINDLFQDHRALQHSITALNQTSGDTFTKKASDRSISLKQVQNSIFRDELLYAYRVMEVSSKSYLFSCAISRSESQCSIKRFDKNFVELSKKFRQNVLSYTDNTFVSDASEKIYEILFGHINLKPFSKLSILPASRDLTLPFNALMDRNNVYLGHKLDLSILLNLNVADAPLETQKSKKYFGIADTLFSTNKMKEPTQELATSVLQSNADFGLRSIETIQKLAALPSLPETRDEVRNISKNIPNEQKITLFGDDATEINWRLSNPSNFSVIHFATHGLTSNEFSSLNEPALVLSRLGNLRTSMDDGLLKASEIAELELNGSTIILSACETAADYGSTKLIGLDGLASAFIFAGAKKVFATQWKVETNSAKNLVSDITDFDNLLRGMKSEATRNPHPFFWAPFLKFEQLSIEREVQKEFEVKSRPITIAASEQVPVAWPAINFNGEPWLLYSYSENIDNPYTKFKFSNLQTGRNFDLTGLGSFSRVIADGEEVLLLGTSGGIIDNKEPVLPAISILNLNTGQLKTPFIYPVDEKVDYANIVASSYNEDKNLVLVIAKAFKSGQRNEFRLIVLDKNYRIKSDIILPNNPKARAYSSQFSFLKGDLLRLTEFNVTPAFTGEVDADYGFINCSNFRKYRLESWDQKLADFKLLDEFDYPFVDFVKEGFTQSSLSAKLLLQNTCRAGFNELEIYDLASGEKQAIAAPLLSVSQSERYLYNDQEFYVLNSTMTLRVGDFMEDPKTFEDHVNVDFFDRTNLLSPGRRYMISIAYRKQNTGEFVLENLIDGRLETYGSSGYSDENGIYLPINREKLSLEMLEISNLGYNNSN